MAFSDDITAYFTNYVLVPSTFADAGAPVTAPVTPYRGERTLDVSTGLTYPLKAERARRHQPSLPREPLPAARAPPDRGQLRPHVPAGRLP